MYKGRFHSRNLPLSLHPKRTNMTNANDQFGQYTGSENWYKYSFGLLITDGARAFADKLGAFWFLDIIGSYQSGLRNQPFQVWKIQKNKTGNGAKVTCEDGNNNVLKSQRIPFTDFPYDEGTLWLSDNVILLPSEY